MRVAFREGARVLSGSHACETLSYRVSGPAVTFRVRANVQNVTAADAAKAAGEAASAQAHAPTRAGEGGQLLGGQPSPQNPDAHWVGPGGEWLVSGVGNGDRTARSDRRRCRGGAPASAVTPCGQNGALVL